MKQTRTCLMGFVFSLFIAGAQAQEIPINEPDYNKPQLFSELPSSLELQISAFESLLSNDLGDKINFTIAPGFIFNGTVVSKASPADRKVQSVVVKSTNYEGAALTFTRVLLEDGTTRYLGRILSMNNSDAYELSYANGKYFFNKKHLYDIMNE